MAKKDSRQHVGSDSNRVDSYGNANAICLTMSFSRAEAVVTLASMGADEPGIAAQHDRDDRGPGPGNLTVTGGIGV